MTTKELLDALAPHVWHEQEKFETLARQMLRELDVVRIFDSDVKLLVGWLRQVYDKGRCRGAYEGDGQ